MSDVGGLLLDFFNDFHLGGGVEGLANGLEEISGPLGKDTASDFHLLNGVGDAVTLVDGDSVGNTITSIANETGDSTSGVEGHDSLEGNIAVRNVELLEHDLNHLLSVALGVLGGLGEEDTVELVGLNTELIAEGVAPDLFHVVPGLNDTSSDGVVQVEDTSLGVSLITDVLSLAGTLDGGLLLWATDHSGEH